MGFCLQLRIFYQYLNNIGRRNQKNQRLLLQEQRQQQKQQKQQQKQQKQQQRQQQQQKQQQKQQQMHQLKIQYPTITGHFNMVITSARYYIYIQLSKVIPFILFPVQ
jgi:sorbitol-specific phosphotransferase system component IIBC